MSERDAIARIIRDNIYLLPTGWDGDEKDLLAAADAILASRPPAEPVGYISPETLNALSTTAGGGPVVSNAAYSTVIPVYTAPPAATAPASTAMVEAEKALFQPIESHAADNLEGALHDIKRLSEAGKPTDAVCIRTIERVIKQLNKAEAALRADKEPGQ